MKKFFLVILVIFILGSLLASCAPTGEDSTSSSSGASTDGESQALLESRCTSCHSVSEITSKKASADEWKSIIERMVQKGAKLSADETAVLVQYLTENYQ